MFADQPRDKRGLFEALGFAISLKPPRVVIGHKDLDSGCRCLRHVKGGPLIRAHSVQNCTLLRIVSGIGERRLKQIQSDIRGFSRQFGG